MEEVRLIPIIIITVITDPLHYVKTVAILTTVVYDDAHFLFSRRSRNIYRLFSRVLLYK